MKINQPIVQLVGRSSSGALLNDHGSGIFLNELTRVALLAVVLSRLYLQPGAHQRGRESVQN